LSLFCALRFALRMVLYASTSRDRNTLALKILNRWIAPIFGVVFIIKVTILLLGPRLPEFDVYNFIVLPGLDIHPGHAGLLALTLLDLLLIIVGIDRLATLPCCRWMLCTCCCRERLQRCLAPCCSHWPYSSQFSASSTSVSPSSTSSSSEEDAEEIN